MNMGLRTENQDALNFMLGSCSFHDASIKEFLQRDDQIDILITDVMGPGGPLRLALSLREVQRADFSFSYGINGSERSYMWIYGLECAVFGDEFQITFFAVPSGSMAIRFKSMAIEALAP